MTKTIDNISCVIIAKNAESKIKEVLDALKDFNDVIIYSNNSTDKTDEIARSYKNVNLIKGDFLGFGPTKNAAADYAKNDWVLSLDADEVISPEFIINLRETQLETSSVYTILRTNFYKQTQIKHCWGDDIITRLYNRTVTSFTATHVHEKIQQEKLHERHITGSVKHYPYENISDFIIKLDRYSTIFAHDYAGKKSASPLKAIANGSFSFFKTYFLKRGFLDGYAGLIIAFSHMATNFYKYMKLYERNKELKKR
jgi:glycosyltransferase involved in cell wall biosynthesis